MSSIINSPGHIYMYFHGQAWALRFKLTPKQRRFLNAKMCWQLCQCRTDEARRLLLGVSQ